MKQYFLFDLDGTLTDPKIGITTCAQYALKSFGIEEPDLDKLEPFIGPPLRESFMEFYGLTKEQAEQAVEKFRERFHDTGIFENELYPGIHDMLRTLKGKGMHLAVASSKPQAYVERILEHFKLASYFEVVVGSEFDGTRENKQEVVQEALNRLFGENPVDKTKVYMIGDRKFDIAGAKSMGVESVGVTYGYGSLEELKEAKADYIVRSVVELKKFLLREVEEAQTRPVKANGSFFGTIWQILYPFLLFILVKQAALYAINLLSLSTFSKMDGALASFWLVKDSAGVPTGFTGNASTIMTGLAYIAAGLAVWKSAKLFVTKAAEDNKLSHLKKDPVSSYVLLGTAVVGIIFGVNLLLELVEITNKSEAYQHLLESQYSANFFVGIVCYGILTPIAEELVFRGIIFNYMKRFMKLKFAIVLSAFCFGAYHMNAVQSAFAFLIGMLMAYGYEYFGSFAIPVGIHIAMNTLSYCTTYTSLASSNFISWPVCLVFLAIGLGSIYCLHKKKNIIT